MSTHDIWFHWQIRKLINAIWLKNNNKKKKTNKKKYTMFIHYTYGAMFYPQYLDTFGPYCISPKIWIRSFDYLVMVLKSGWITNNVGPAQTCSVASDFGLHRLPRPIWSNTLSNYGTVSTDSENEQRTTCWDCEDTQVGFIHCCLHVK